MLSLSLSPSLHITQPAIALHVHVHRAMHSVHHQMTTDLSENNLDQAAYDTEIEIETTLSSWRWSPSPSTQLCITKSNRSAFSNIRMVDAFDPKNQMASVDYAARSMKIEPQYIKLNQIQSHYRLTGEKNAC